MGRPPGKGPTRYWTKAERKLARDALDYLRAKMPYRTERSIINMMLRMEGGEFDDHQANWREPL